MSLSPTHIYKVWLLTVISFTVMHPIDAQQMDLYAQMKNTYDVQPTEVTMIEGYLDNALPLTIAYTAKDNLLKGLINYGGNSTTHIIEGTESDSIISLYEFEDATVTAVLSGPPPDRKINWSWSTHDYSRNLPIVVHNSNNVIDGQVIIYGDVLDKDRSQILIRPDRDQISIELENSINLRWMDYACEGEHCVEGRPNMSLDNPVEFKLEGNTVQVYPSRTLTKLHELNYKTTAKSNESNFYSFAYPVTDQSTFDNWVTTLIKKHIPKDEVAAEEDEAGDYSDRFKYRSYGDFYITLLSKEIISGYMMFYNTTSNRMETSPFNYNLREKKFYRAKDLFRKDFNYTFFLNSSIEKKKRDLLYKEEGIIKELVEEATFGHYVLSPGGIIFFTDFSSIFGRRHILIPYTDIQGFINDKSLSNYIKKERFR